VGGLRAAEETISNLLFFYYLRNQSGRYIDIIKPEKQE
jgi:hypothetical protein